jgi:hypothetical protein
LPTPLHLQQQRQRLPPPQLLLRLRLPARPLRRPQQQTKQMKFRQKQQPEQQ